MPLQAAQQDGNRLSVAQHTEQFHGMHRCPAMRALCVCHLLLNDRHQLRDKGRPGSQALRTQCFWQVAIHLTQALSQRLLR